MRTGRQRGLTRVAFALLPVAGVLLLGWDAPVLLTWHWATLVPAVLVDPYLSRIVWPDPLAPPAELPTSAMVTPPLSTLPPPSAFPPPVFPRPAPPPKRPPTMEINGVKVRIDPAGMLLPRAPTLMRQGMVVMNGFAALLIFTVLASVGGVDWVALPVAVIVQTLRRLTVERQERMQVMRKHPYPSDALMLVAVFMLSFLFASNPGVLLTAVCALGLLYELLVERAERRALRS